MSKYRTFASRISCSSSSSDANKGSKSRVCEFTGLECENGALEWNTGVEY